jgi:Tn3 transposase DDE domain
LKRAVFHDNHGKFRVRTELEQHIWSECTRFIANCIIFWNASLLSALYETTHNAGGNTEAKQIAQISPVAWRHINLRGRFEFQKQARITDIDQVISSLQQKITLQELAMNQEPVERDAYFTFLRG